MLSEPHLSIPKYEVRNKPIAANAGPIRVMGNVIRKLMLEQLYRPLGEYSSSLSEVIIDSGVLSDHVSHDWELEECCGRVSGSPSFCGIRT
jgi:hypothetical protein